MWQVIAKAILDNVALQALEEDYGIDDLEHRSQWLVTTVQLMLSVHHL
jgi:hypothetical protein